MSSVNVNTTAQLETALSVATSGETILLAPGTYDDVSVDFLSLPTGVTVTSAVSTNKAVLTGLTVNNCSNLAFSNLNFSTAAAVVGASVPYGIWPFNVYGSSNIKFSQINIYGSPTGTLATQVSGLGIQNSVNCTVTGCNFTYLANGLSINNDTGLMITKNAFSWILDDGIHGGGTSYVTINKNTFTNQFYLPNNPVHPDAIQFWTTGATQSATNITITNNTYTRGAGGYVHGVFVKDEVGNLPYRNVIISGNKITGGGWDGIYVLDATNLTVTNNTVQAYADETTHIWITNAQGTVTGNKAASFLYVNDPNLITTGNTYLAPIPVPTAAAHGPAAFAQTMALMAGGGAVHGGVGPQTYGAGPASLAVVQ